MSRNNLKLVFGIFLAVMFVNVANAQSTGWTTQNPSNCSDEYGAFDAFVPGMRGHGSCNRGGFVPGTTVIRVTNTNSSGSGSLAAAAAAACPKVILFDVSGTVEFSGNHITTRRCDHWSIVGASAPGQFTLISGDSIPSFTGLGNHWTVDNMTITTQDGGGSSDSRDVVAFGTNVEEENIIVMNNNFIWGGDEDVQCYPNAAVSVSKILYWQNIIGLGWKTEGDGTNHRFAHIMNGNCLQNASIRNLYIHAEGRAPFARPDGYYHANNMTFNSGIQNYVAQPCGGAAEFTETFRQNIVNNFQLKGPDSTGHVSMQFQGATCKSSTKSVYESGNALQIASTQAISNCTNHSCTSKPSEISWADSPITYAQPDGHVPETFDPSSDAELTSFANNLLEYVGARPADRLPYIEGKITEVRNGLAGSGDMGGQVTSISSEGGFAVVTAASRTRDSTTQCGGMPTGAAADAIQSSGLTGLHEWVIGCFYDDVMPPGYREGGLANYPDPEPGDPVVPDDPEVTPNPPTFF